MSEHGVEMSVEMDGFIHDQQHSLTDPTHKHTFTMPATALTTFLHHHLTSLLGPTLDRAKSEPYSNDNCDRLIAQTCNRYLGGFLQLFPKLRLLLGKVNDGTSSKYKRLPSALTKCLLQVRV